MTAVIEFEWQPAIAWLEFAAQSGVAMGLRGLVVPSIRNNLVTPDTATVLAQYRCGTRAGQVFTAWTTVDGASPRLVDFRVTRQAARLSIGGGETRSQIVFGLSFLSTFRETVLTFDGSIARLDLRE